MSLNLSLETIKDLVGETIDSFENAINLLRDLRDGIAGNDDINEFFVKIGVETAEPQAALENKQRNKVSTAINLLQRTIPFGALKPRDWDQYTDCREALILALDDLDPSWFTTILESTGRDQYLVGQSLRIMASSASQGMVHRPGPTHKHRAFAIELVAELLREFRA